MAATFCCGIDRRNGIKALSVFWIIISILCLCHYGDLAEYIGKKDLVFYIVTDVVSIFANILLFIGATKNIRWMVLVWLIFEMIGIILLTLYCIIIVTLVVAKVEGISFIDTFSIGWYIELVLIVGVSIFFWNIVHRFYKKDMKESTNNIATLPRMV